MSLHPRRFRQPAFGFGSRNGFTLVEILVAAAITVVLVGVLLGISTLTSNVVKQSSAKLSAFAAGRTAFDIMTQKLSQATLNTYLDYYGTGFGGVSERRTQINSAFFTPTSYGRASDLQFYIRKNVQTSAGMTGNHGQEVYFQAPIAYSSTATYQSVQGLLNACGYYVTYGDSTAFRPAAVTTSRYRYRLMQAMEPTESFSVFAHLVENAGTGAVADNATTWMANIGNTATGPPAALTSVDVAPLADNVIALVIWPRASPQSDPNGTLLTSNYTYDSQAGVAPTSSSGNYIQSITADQLPPILQVSMIVIDEASALRLTSTTPANAPTVIETALTGKFVTVAQNASDMSSIISSLSLNHISFQVFSANVAMRESKWSENPGTQ